MTKIPLMVFLCGALLAIGSTGCTTAFQTASTVQVTADAAMTAWGDYVVQYHPDDATRSKVRDAYVRYQTAMLAVADAGEALAMFTETNSTSTNAPASNAALTAASAQAAQALADLVSLLQTVGVKVQ